MLKAKPRRPIYRHQLRCIKHRNLFPVAIVVAVLSAFWLYIGWAVTQVMEGM